ncbi:ParA family protein [Vibrio salinus]|uniref:ParA family protein n=1 Tax=Vibrio salinus TaxID=2899784 RepID=UPI001E2FCB54|nr:ParA family protein [Vibrio salinus]MCE0494578.1 ParA family protein [Vibrio salinus]
MIVWSIANQKGGVGKTTTTITLAGLLCQQGKRVLLVDTDPHASLTTYLGYDSDDMDKNLFDLFQIEKLTQQSVQSLIINSEIGGLDIIPAHMSLATLDRVMGNRSGMGLILKKALLELKHIYDYVLIDCPPILGVMMVNALAASDRILIPVQTEFLAMKGLERMIRTLAIMQRSRSREFKVTIVPTMYDKRTKASLLTLNQLKKDYPDQVWSSAVPIDTKFRDASLKRLPASHFASGSRGVFAYKQLLIYLERLAIDES